MKIAVLFTTRVSIYKTLRGVDCYDIDRDATTWPGGSPVIAHPPCRLWSSLAHMSTAPLEEKELTPWAVEQVRRWGGVFEHPQRSQIWRTLPKPWRCDEFGMTIECDQWHWGHVASKPTRLYVCGVAKIPPIPIRFGSPWKTVTGIIGQPGRRCTDAERQATPPEFAKWLIKIARSVRLRTGNE